MLVSIEELARDFRVPPYAIKAMARKMGFLVRRKHGKGWYLRLEDAEEVAREFRRRKDIERRERGH